jgi:hypothetical protein
MAELPLEIAAEARQRRMVDVQCLEDDRRAALELRGDALDLRGSGEGRRRPGDALGVVAERVLLAFLDDSEGRIPEPAARDAALDFLDRQEVVEAPLLVPRNEEGFLLPVLVEEAFGLDGPDAAR